MPRFRPRMFDTTPAANGASSSNGQSGHGHAEPGSANGAVALAEPVMQPLPQRPASQPVKPMPDELRALVGKVQERLLKRIDQRFEQEVRDVERLKRHIADATSAIIAEENIVLPQAEVQRLQKYVMADVVGLGPLEEMLADGTITEIMVNGPFEIFVERYGVIEECPLKFNDDAHLRRVIERIVAPLGRRVNESSPMVDARLPDGSRVNIVIPPIALNGATVTIRKFAQTPLAAADLITSGAVPAEVMEFLRACVYGRMNIVVTGGTGAGKTTLLNVLSGFIPDNERIITIENAAELQLQQRHVVTLESRPANIEGKGEVTIRDLVVNALRMRPNRIVVGECRSGETLDMLQAMNTGHDGSLTTIHANSPRDALGRLETMVLMSGMDLPVRAIREQVSSAIHLIVHVDRLTDGSRRVTRVCEITGMEGDVVTMSDLFVFRQEAIRDGRIFGRLVPTGIRPRLLEELKRYNLQIPASTFGYGSASR